MMGTITSLVHAKETVPPFTRKNLEARAESSDVSGVSHLLQVIRQNDVRNCNYCKML